MSDDQRQTPARGGDDPGPGPGGLYDVSRLAQRLGIETATLRSARHRGVDWLPEPVGTLNGAPVWAEADLVGIESRRRGAGRPRRTATPLDGAVTSGDG